MKKKKEMKGEKGTLTFHLPLKRGPERPPEMTLMIRRVMDNRWHAGLAVCSTGDQFVRRTGRRVACSRLLGRPFMVDSPEGLVGQVADHLDNLIKNRPYTISIDTLQDLDLVAQRISKMRIE